MTIEYSNEIRGVYAYRFEAWEMKVISSGLEKEVVILKKKVDKIRNHPKNEGQATYLMQIAELKEKIETLFETINHFDNN